MSVDFNFIDILIKNYWIENRSFYIMSEGIIGKCQISDVPTECREMRSPGGSCFPLCNLLKNSVTSGVILKVNMSLFGCKLFSICVSRSQKCRNVHSQGVYLIMS